MSKQCAAARVSLRRIAFVVGPRGLGITLLLSLVSPAEGAGPLGANGDAIATSEYAIDLYQGPVFAGTRVTGLGGAYVAIAEDIDGSLQNPATPAVRPFYSIDYFDFYPAIGLTFPATVSGVDFFNSGAKTELYNSPDTSLFVTPALNLQWGSFGVGLTAEVQNYSFRQTDTAQASNELGAVIAVVHTQFANAWADGQLMLGVGLRNVSMSLDTVRRTSADDDSEDSGAFAITGTGPEVGLLWRPNGQPYRIGIAYRSDIETIVSFSENLLPNADGDVILSDVDGLYLPKRLSVPWDLNLGLAVQLGTRPFNPRWRSIDDLSEKQWLEHRLAELHRRQRRDARLRGAKSDVERERINAEYEQESEAAEEKLERVQQTVARAMRETWRQRSRFYLLMSASVLVSGRAHNAVGIESFLSQEVNRSGERVVFSPRLGVETEIWPDLLKLRAGSYLEPTRFETSRERLHGTGGVDLRVGSWDVFGIWPEDYAWRFGAVVDVAPRYFSWGVSVGGWFPRLPRD